MPPPDSRAPIITDVELPATSSVERTIAVLDKCQALVRKIKGVQDVLALTDPDVPHRGQLLVSLAADAGAAEHAKQVKAMRLLLHEEVADAAIAASLSVIMTVRWWATMSCISRAIRVRSAATASAACWSRSRSSRSARSRSSAR